MPFLKIGSLTVPVAVTGAEQELVEIGEIARAFDGTPRSSVRDHAGLWHFQTAPMKATDADSLLTALQGAPLSCEGDFSAGSTVSCVATEIQVRYVKVSGAVYRTVSFALLGSP